MPEFKEHLIGPLKFLPSHVQRNLEKSLEKHIAGHFTPTPTVSVEVGPAKNREHDVYGIQSVGVKLAGREVAVIPVRQVEKDNVSGEVNHATRFFVNHAALEEPANRLYYQAPNSSWKDDFVKEDFAQLLQKALSDSHAVVGLGDMMDEAMRRAREEGKRKKDLDL